MSPSTDRRENREFAAELKFMVPRDLAERIRDWARTRLAPDPNANGETGDGYQISSLYFDTEQFDVYHRHGSFGRSKYRIRRYGASELVFLERKLKTRGLVSKRRSFVKIMDLRRLSQAEPEAHWAGFWFHQRLLARRLNPKCQIGYHRTARVLMTNCGPIRLTLDDNLRTQAADGLNYGNSHGGAILAENHVILELKYLAQMPAVFKLLVEEFALNPQPVSKYRMAMTALGFVTEAIPQPATQNRPAESLCQIS